jgi:hypothetical protein
MPKPYLIGAPEPTGIKTSCDSAAGLVVSCRKKGIKIYCPTCKTTQPIIKCDSHIIHAEQSSSYFVWLECGCPEGRVYTINVKRPKRPEGEE